MKKREVIWILIFVLIIVFLLGLNTLFGVSISLVWMISPELDQDSIQVLSKHKIQVDIRQYTDYTVDEAYTSSSETDMNLSESEGFNGTPSKSNSGLSSISESSREKDIGIPKFSNFSKLFDGRIQCNIVNPSQRFDCHPENNLTEEKCESRGCCWFNDQARQKPIISPNSTSSQSPIDVPFCYYPRDYPGYHVTSKVKTDLGFRTMLERNSSSYYPKDVKQLVMDVMMETNGRLHVKIYDPSSRRYEVPLDVPRASVRAPDPSYTVSVGEPGDPFFLTVRRTNDNSSPPVFSTQGAAPLFFTDQFLQLSSILPSSHIYGLGEHRTGLMLDVDWTRRTMWNADRIPAEGTNVYGSHPFYIVMEEGGKSNGFFLLNSNAMDVILQPYPAVTWRTIGGVLDFYIFIGQSPSDIVKEYTAVIGQPFMPPYWSLGLHISRYGYKTVDDVMKVVNRLRKAGIPQDTQWTDIDYMVGYLDFTTDIARFGDQAGLVTELHGRGMHYCIIVDPGISNTQPNGTYLPYDLGMEMDIFIKNDSNLPLVGKVFPGPTVFPDFTNPLSQKYWTTMIQGFHDKIQFDGLLTDMNELSNIVDGSINGCPNTEYDNPPYVPAVSGGKLCKNTICASAIQEISINYDVHNLYGLMETNATYQALKTTRGTRPFVISRSTFSGQGHYGGHWTGDNAATYHDMYMSISAVLTMNLVGIPMVGANICGFRFNTTYEQCLRWYQLGAFYPYSITHNNLAARKDQDPGAFDHYFAVAVRKVYLTRYSLLPYLYTLFHLSSVNGAPVARPMFYEFPEDVITYNIETQFFWGSSLLIAPVLTEEAVSVEVYLPLKSLWYDFYTGEIIAGTGNSVVLAAPLDVINLLVQGGSIIPMQEPALTTTESRTNDFSLLAAVDSTGVASGRLFWDDGDSLDTYTNGVFNEIEFYLTQNMLFSNVSVSGYPTNMLLGNITIFGVWDKPESVKINGTDEYFLFDSSTKVLRVPSLCPKVNLLQAFVLEWS